jgi:hypothetical protein
VIVVIYVIENLPDKGSQIWCELREFGDLHTISPYRGTRPIKKMAYSMGCCAVEMA